ncbi:hypothetical protein CsatB_003854 [Cannabis sativa]
MERANFNLKAMHALFNTVSKNQLKVIVNYEMAKEAWEKLRIKNEGTDPVKKSRLRALAKAFEDLSMEEEETVAEFHAKLCDISNESHALGKTYSNVKLVCKVLRVLPRRFMSKVTSIEEMRNVEELDLDELIGSFIAFIHKEEKKSIPDVSASFSDEVVDLLTKNYTKFLKKKYKKFFLRVECSNTLKKKKALVATWSDSDEEKDFVASKSSDEDKQVVAFMEQSHRSFESEVDGVFSVFEADSNGRQNAYEEMFPQWEYMTKRIRVLNSAKEQIESENIKLEDTVKNLNKLLDENDNEIYKLSAELIRAKQALEFIPPGTMPSFKLFNFENLMEGQWYLDIGCSRHMTGKKKLLVNYKEEKEGVVTFGDGNKGQIIGKGDLVMSRVAPLTEVLYVKGLKANLISISQLCDADYTISFSKTHCLVSSYGCSVLTGKRSSDGSYLLDNVVLCNSASLDKSDIGDFTTTPKVLTKRNKSVKSSPCLSRVHSLLLVLWYGLLNLILLNLGFKQRKDDVFVLVFAGFDHVAHRTLLFQKKYGRIKVTGKRLRSKEEWNIS